MLHRQDCFYTKKGSGVGGSDLDLKNVGVQRSGAVFRVTIRRERKAESHTLILSEQLLSEQLIINA